MSISLDQLGAPGVHGIIEIVPLFTDEHGKAPEPKQCPKGVHEFKVKARLAKSPGQLTLKGDFGLGDGESYLTVSNEVARLEVGGFGGLLKFHRNSLGELSTVNADLLAESSQEAHNLFVTQLTAFLDRLSYLASIPLFVDLVVVAEPATDRQSMYFVSPPRSSQINAGGETLHVEMAPVYALYREAQNSVSPYYRVLCLFKIMEGLLLSLRSEMRKRARSAGVELNKVKSFVPDHPDLPSGLKGYVGKPIKDVFDNFLQKEFRDAMAHFNLKGRHPLNVSAHDTWRRFVDVAFLSDLCARVLIAQHEQLLTSFDGSLPGLR
ncbi:hypothetical protein SAMN05192583_0088 [Sphingomonas gellani]|uniref:Uncharacterized protein n=1 Tax=Sphingomonas gellani TaxID=1166340 RepID=A0A1H7Y3Y7_9SPHN|nr:methylamine utilization protein MauJ [Sphingomonas gellani]SEM40926.1 hypothetical protein SAMN05192583_0088 [Sphingomonas gellani]